jgi:hypothetical protein
MWGSEKIIQSVAYDNYNDVKNLNFTFSQNLVSLFWELFNGKTDLRVREITLELNVQCYAAT